MYESQDSVPLLRVAWNKIDPNYLATFMMDSQKLLIIDTRNPGIPVAELSGHSSPINSFAWAPHSSCHVCTAGMRVALFSSFRRLANACPPFCVQPMI